MASAAGVTRRAVAVAMTHVLLLATGIHVAAVLLERDQAASQRTSLINIFERLAAMLAIGKGRLH